MHYADFTTARVLCIFSARKRETIKFIAKAKWSLLNSGGAIISKTEHRILYCCDEPLSYVRQIPHNGWGGLETEVEISLPYLLCRFYYNSCTMYFFRWWGWEIGNFILIVIVKLFIKLSIESSIVVMYPLSYVRQIPHNGWGGLKTEVEISLL